jgi:ABC-2 type transport system ATP-binding protein
MSQELAIEVSDLTKTYREGMIFRKKFQALKGISFSVPRGQIFGLLGPNGAGKTTFLKILLGVIRKSGGNAAMLGHPAGSLAGRNLVGYLPERLRIPQHMTGYTALEVFGNLSNVPTSTIKKKRDSLIDMVGLTGRAKDKVKKYSKGMQQRLGLAQALLNDPQMLVLDEPTDGLDPQARAEMRAIIRRLKEDGVTIFLNSHILQEVELICDNVAILDQGNMRYCGPVDQIGEFVKSQLGVGGGEHQVEFRVKGDVKTIADAIQKLGGILVANQRAASEQVFTVGLPDQAAIDRAVDELRGQGVSLVGMNIEQVSLEEAFLRIVGGSNDDTVQGNQQLLQNF